MFAFLTHQKGKFLFSAVSRLLVFVLSFSLVFGPSAAQAQTITSLNLPVPGAMVGPSQAFVPVLLKGMTIHPDNPLQFDFIIDSGNTNFTQDRIKDESQRLVKYFLASMTIPKDDLWVNLSPYEKDRIIPDELGKTELGRDMLAQDYILKQLTASLIYPEKELGKAFWDKVYKQAKEKYGTTEIPVNTFNKVWILPETATVYEHGQTVYIVEAKLKVMLDSDYLATSHNVTRSPGHNDATGDVVTGDRVTTEIVKEIILPAIEKEVNEGQNFAPLRQIYHSLILAKWYKETIKNSLLSKIYVDQKKIAGVNLDDATLKDQIYAQYMEAYKKGVFNYIKEDYDRLSNETIPRKYFSGGITGDVKVTKSSSPVKNSGFAGKGFILATTLAGALSQSPSLWAQPPVQLTNPKTSETLEQGNETNVQTPQSQSPKAIKELVDILFSEDISNRDVVGEYLLYIVGRNSIIYLEEIARQEKNPQKRSDAQRILESLKQNIELEKLGDQKQLSENEIGQIIYKSRRHYKEFNDFEYERDWGFKTKQPAINLLRRQLRGGDYSEKISSLKILSKIGLTAEEALPEIIDSLNDKDYTIRAAAAILLSQMSENSRYAFGPLTDIILNDKEYELIKEVSRWALNSITKKSKDVAPLSERVYRSLHNYIKTDDDIVRSMASRDLFLLGSAAAPELLNIVKFGGHKESTTALSFLRVMGPQAYNIFPEITEMLNSKYLYDRYLAAKLLEKIGVASPQNSVLTLLKSLRNTESMSGSMTRGQPVALQIILTVMELSKNNAELRDKVIIPILMEDIKSQEYVPTYNALEVLYYYGSKAQKTLPFLRNVVQNPEKYFGKGYPAGLLSHTKFVINILEKGLDPLGKDKGNIEIYMLPKENGSSPVSMNDLLTVPTGLIGALEENGQILSVKMGEVLDIGFGDFGRQLFELGLEHPFLSIAALTAMTYGLYYYWSRHTVSGNLYRLWSSDKHVLKAVTESLKRLGATNEQITAGYLRATSYYYDDVSTYDFVTFALWELGANKEQLFNVHLMALERGSPYIHSTAAYRLGELGDIRAIKPLEKLLLSTPETIEVVERYGTYGEPQGVHEEQNPDYFTIEHALVVLRKRLRDSSSSPVAEQQGIDSVEQRADGLGLASDKVGGIDMNTIDLEHQGAGVDIQFDPTELQEIIDAGIDGFAPVIINITPLPSVLPLLGLEPQRKEDELEVSSLN